MDKNVKRKTKRIFSLVFLLFFIGANLCSCSDLGFTLFGNPAVVNLGQGENSEGTKSDTGTENITDSSDDSINDSANDSGTKEPDTADETLSLPDRSATEEEKIGNFADGGLTGYGASNNYKNGDSMFNCKWSKNNVTFADGIMTLSLTKSDGTDNVTYYGAEYHSDGRDNNWGYNYTTGFYSVSMKPAKKSGVISSFFVWNGSPWNEIDIEFLGKDTTKVQFNYYTEGQGGHEYLYDLGFDASEEFHEYSFDWAPDSITWYVDGKAVYRATDNTPAKGVYTRLMMNVWNGTGDSFDQWAGAFSGTDLPVAAQYSWIAYRVET